MESMSKDLAALSKETMSNFATLQSMETGISEIKTLLQAQERQSKLEFQFSCAEVGAFDVKDFYSTIGHVVVKSTELVRHILKSFALGVGYQLRTLHINDSVRDRLKEQIATITGQEPRFEQDYRGSWWIYDH